MFKTKLKDPTVYIYNIKLSKIYSCFLTAMNTSNFEKVTNIYKFYAYDASSIIAIKVGYSVSKSAFPLSPM